jgi:hypothetical protein
MQQYRDRKLSVRLEQSMGGRFRILGHGLKQRGPLGFAELELSLARLAIGFLGCWLIGGCALSKSTNQNPANRPASTSSAPAPAQTSKGDKQIAGPVVKELAATFRYRDKPVHPLLLQKFLSLISDREPPVLTVNVASLDNSNEFSAEVTEKDGEFTCEHTVQGPAGSETLVFRYKRLGALADGTQVVQTTGFSQSAPNIRSDLMFLKPVDYQLVDASGKTSTVAGLHLRGLLPLTASDNPVVSLRKTGVHIKVDSNSNGIDVRFAP